MAMSAITSCTLLSGRPLATPANSTSARRLQSARPTAVALPSFQRKCRSLSVCRAGRSQKDIPMELHPFNIPASALVNLMPQRDERWRLEERSPDAKHEVDRVILGFDVSGHSREDLIVEIDEDVLVVKKNGKKTGDVGQDDNKQATDVARLFVPSGYNRESVKANAHSGKLEVSIAKIRDTARRKVKVEITDEPDIEY